MFPCWCSVFSSGKPIFLLQIFFSVLWLHTYRSHETVFFTQVGSFRTLNELQHDMVCVWSFSKSMTMKAILVLTALAGLCSCIPTLVPFASNFSVMSAITPKGLIYWPHSTVFWQFFPVILTSVSVHAMLLRNQNLLLCISILFRLSIYRCTQGVRDFAITIF